MSYITSKILSIPKTLCIISECWSNAEDSLRNDIRDNYPDIDEECITQLFHRRFAKELRLKSEENVIAMAFLADLRENFRYLGINELRKIANGLIADVTLHRKHTEGRTGGDFGFKIIRPQVKYSYCYVLKVSDYQRGILCQAKLKRPDGKWGAFSMKQKNRLPERLNYLTLLLYSYADKTRYILQPFQWQRCDLSSLSFEQVKGWLKNGSFPSLENSGDIIKKLGNGSIGTDDKKALEEIVSPVNNPSLIIRIYWPDDKHPGSEVRVTLRPEIKRKNVVKIRRQG